MTALVRNFFTNTGLKGSPIKWNKPKLSVAFTAVRNEAGEQVVQFGVSACHPNDHAVFKRKEGLNIAKARLLLEQTGPHEGLSVSTAMSIGTVTFPATTSLDQIPGLLVKVYDKQVRKAKGVKWKAKDDALKTLKDAYEAKEVLLNTVYQSEEYLSLNKIITQAEDVLYGSDELF